MPGPLDKIPRVDQINILGVTFSDTLKVNTHIDATISKCSACLYALKVLRTQGIGKENLQHIFQSVITTRLLYAIPAWWGFASAHDKHRLQAFMDRSVKFGFCDRGSSNIEVKTASAHVKLFEKIQSNRQHVLHKFLPPPHSHDYALRPRRHSFCAPVLTSHTMKGFFGRLLHDI